METLKECNSEEIRFNTDYYLNNLELLAIGNCKKKKERKKIVNSLLIILRSSFYWLGIFNLAFTGLVTERVIKTSSNGLSLPSLRTVAICSITSIPDTTLPKTTCFPSSQGVGTSVMKN
ncbi:hypothetical protein QR98_0038110 [Sarcoptes scabiei]|uniref:Uncharacterized protein n=1 Tax=Sarcoptes scabiei TaxID=52283 RepID=A0A132A3C7_SARSC|nr:hypothetical protein QR98_0038110 [Sarcoptes scabiei]